MDVDELKFEISDDALEKLDIQDNKVEKILDEMIACVNEITDDVG